MSFSDPIDQGSHLAELHNQASLEAQMKKNQPEQVKEWIEQEDGSEVFDWPIKECVEEDCGEPIEPARLEMGRIRCFSCQTLLEERNKRYAKR